MKVLQSRAIRLSYPTALTAVLSLSPTSLVRRVRVSAFSSQTKSTTTSLKTIRHLDDLSWFQTPDTNAALFPVYNPAEPAHIIAHAPIHTRADVTLAIERSDAALERWRDGTTPAYRASLLIKWSQLIQQHKHDIATIMTLESGKPLAESIGEVTYGTSFLDYYAAEAVRFAGTLLPSAFSYPDGSPRGQSMAMHRAVGVTALITPWNFPIAMITRKVAPALATGCTALVKPSELTPLTALLLQELAHQAGIPESVLQTITTDREHTPQVGHELCTNPLVQKISFTGSTAVGKLLMEQSASTVKRLSLELGGNAPFLVFEDADLDQAVAAAVASKFRNAGQTCVCSDRFLVQSTVYDEFISKFAAAINNSEKGLVVGNGMHAGVTMGPLISKQACDSVHQKVQDAIAAGAKCVTGGHVLESLGSPNFFAPTILKDVPLHTEIWKSETFGPVAAVVPFDSEQEALALANDSSTGLASYFMTRDLSRTFRVAKALEAGIVGVNDGIISTCTAPFGGIKESGLGREGGAAGLQEYLESKYVFINY